MKIVIALYSDASRTIAEKTRFSPALATDAEVQQFITEYAMEIGKINPARDVDWRTSSKKRLGDKDAEVITMSFDAIYFLTGEAFYRQHLTYYIVDVLDVLATETLLIGLYEYMGYVDVDDTTRVSKPIKTAQDVQLFKSEFEAAVKAFAGAVGVKQKSMQSCKNVTSDTVMLGENAVKLTSYKFPRTHYNGTAYHLYCVAV